jgi:hypothetical protein
MDQTTRLKTQIKKKSQYYATVTSDNDFKQRIMNQTTFSLLFQAIFCISQHSKIETKEFNFKKYPNCRKRNRKAEDEIGSDTTCKLFHKEQKK